MMPRDMIDQRLLNDFQRDLPLVPRPFAAIGRELRLDEAGIIARLGRLREAGHISRVGATCRPNTAGASTLAALDVPSDRIEAVAAVVGGEPGVNHSYLREGRPNLWFVATAPDQQALAASLARIECGSGLPVLSLPLIRAFNIDLGFCLNGTRRAMPNDRPPDPGAMRDGDRAIMQALSSGLALTARPFGLLAQKLDRTEKAVIDRIRALSDAALLTRVGVIVRHRSLGWRENAMVVWDVPDHRIEAAGRALVAIPGVTLCYQRPRLPGRWEHPLFCMIHARTRADAATVLKAAQALPQLADVDHQVLFSTRCFKQRGAMIAEVAA